MRSVLLLAYKPMEGNFEEVIHLKTHLWTKAKDSPFLMYDGQTTSIAAYPKSAWFPLESCANVSVSLSAMII